MSGEKKIRFVEPQTRPGRPFNAWTRRWPLLGPKPRLSQGQKKKLEKIPLRGAAASGYATDLTSASSVEPWTCPRVAEVIEKGFGTSYHPYHVWRLLWSMGWSCQKPERRARERDEEAIRRWRNEQRGHRSILEKGMRSDRSSFSSLQSSGFHPEVRMKNEE